DEFLTIPPVASHERTDSGQFTIESYNLIEASVKATTQNGRN
ncbi:unnamed protein product, partial [Rotaria magnacalcarata]